MKKITINPSTFYENYNALRKKWEEANKAFLSIDEFSIEQLNSLCNFLLKKMMSLH